MPQLPSLPVIFLTRPDTSADIAIWYRTHANASVTKPTTLEESVRLVEAFEAFRFEHARLPPTSS
ncbi:response regulator [Natrinema versiforme]|uniref:Response regulator receiver protein n=1 Tax=Natrinema versiforme JCM 10478 TaxID=1227496 RepID=L9Y6F2_9EURY|nr:response regulator [Natrinema versiforme]ELY68478.1 response regulator receiver protein [Natrinema versiforme JCM 10478]